LVFLFIDWQIVVAKKIKILLKILAIKEKARSYRAFSFISISELAESSSIPSSPDPQGDRHELYRPRSLPTSVVYNDAGQKRLFLA
jgi:hypothetical protein